MRLAARIARTHTHSLTHTHTHTHTHTLLLRSCCTSRRKITVRMLHEADMTTQHATHRCKNRRLSLFARARVKPDPEMHPGSLRAGCARVNPAPSHAQNHISRHGRKMSIMQPCRGWGIHAGHVLRCFNPSRVANPLWVKVRCVATRVVTRSLVHWQRVTHPACVPGLVPLMWFPTASYFTLNMVKCFLIRLQPDINPSEPAVLAARFRERRMGGEVDTGHN